MEREEVVMSSKTSGIQEENPWAGKRVFITGVCGTIGQELLRQLSRMGPSEIIGVDNNESALFFLAEEYRESPDILFYLGDIRDRNKMMRKMQGVDIVIHAAALKHVILCEESPEDAVQTNILGLQNIIDAATANNVERVLFTSSDKAVNPTNVMGTSKLMGERLMTAANALRRSNGPVFASTRFGNVLGSNGSVMPLFKRQITQGGPLTLTDPHMSRFIMTLQEAVELVMRSTFLARGGEVFITKMPSVRIEDLAYVMIETIAPRCGFTPEEIEVRIIGSKPGEKFYEELMNDEETRRALELPQYFSILPAFKSVHANIEYDYPDALGEVEFNRPYNSASVEPMDRQALKEHFNKYHLLD